MVGFIMEENNKIKGPTNLINRKNQILVVLTTNDITFENKDGGNADSNETRLSDVIGPNIYNE